MTPRLLISAFCFLLSALAAESATLTAYRTWWTFGYYAPANSLEHHLWTNWTARTNGRNAQLLSFAGHVQTVQATNALWNTNWFFYGTENFTAQTHVRTNSGEAWYAKKSALISRVLLLQSGHNNCYDQTNGGCGTNQWYLAVDATNGQHWRRVVWAISRAADGTNAPGYPAPYQHGDYYLAAVHEPWPTNIGTMKIALAGTLSNKVHASGAAVYPRFYDSQFARTEPSGSFAVPGTWQSLHPTAGRTNQSYAGGNITVFATDGTSTATNGLGTSTGGDSGSPTFIVVSNRLVLAATGQTAAQIENVALFLADVNTATTNAGYTTNQYPVEFEALEHFPNRP